MDTADKLAVAVILAFVALAVLLGLTLEATACDSRWENTEFQSDWGPMKGCRISRDGRVWIPEQNYREIP
jgi:hypothetical protein